MQVEYAGYGSVSRIYSVAEEKGIKRVFVVADRGAYGTSGAQAALEACFGKEAISSFDDFESNPRIEDLEKGIDALRKCEADAIVAVGGGTAIDLAKMANVLAMEEHGPLDFVLNERRISKPGRLLIAIPTTSGTGSESTRFAVVYVDKEKHSLEHDCLLPDVAIVDPALTASMPPVLTASTGLDALCQGIESLWSVRSTGESMNYAREAIRLALRHIEKAVVSPDRESREAMSLAAHLSGKAINISKTTGPHAFSYYFTSYHDIPHGHAAALTLGNFLVYNNDVSDKDIADARGVEHVRNVMAELYRLLGAADGISAREKFRSIIRKIGLEHVIAKTGFSLNEELQSLLSRINIDRLSNNPRKVTESAVPMLVS